jgi:hypothetical protein
MLATLAAAALAAAPQLKVAVLDVNAVGFAADAKNFYTQQVGIELSEFGVSASTPQQIAALLGYERNKQLLGCAEGSTECLVELANALGVDGIAMTDLAKIGSVYQVSLRIIDSRGGQAVATFTKRVQREEDVLSAVGEGAREVAVTAAKALGRSLNAKIVARTGGTARVLAIVPGVLGLAAGGVAIGLFAAAASDHDKLTSPSAPTIDVNEGVRIRDEGRTFQTVGIVMSVTAGAALVAAGAMAIFGGPTETTPELSVTPVPGGAALMFGGKLP